MLGDTDLYGGCFTFAHPEDLTLVEKGLRNEQKVYGFNFTDERYDEGT